jgi:hypothetical protein
MALRALARLEVRARAVEVLEDADKIDCLAHHAGVFWLFCLLRLRFPSHQRQVAQQC